MNVELNGGGPSVVSATISGDIISSATISGDTIFGETIFDVPKFEKCILLIKCTGGLQT